MFIREGQNASTKQDYASKKGKEVSFDTRTQISQQRRYMKDKLQNYRVKFIPIARHIKQGLWLSVVFVSRKKEKIKGMKNKKTKS